mgnify:CR=1 FL=1
MGYVSCLKCRGCSRETEIGPYNVCDYCFGPLEVVYDYDAMRPSISREAIVNGPHTMWRYKDLLPVDTDKVIDISAGYTPLVKADNLGRKLGLEQLYIELRCHRRRAGTLQGDLEDQRCVSVAGHETGRLGKFAAQGRRGALRFYTPLERRSGVQPSREFV